jgi:hypothetical protein
MKMIVKEARSQQNQQQTVGNPYALAAVMSCGSHHIQQHTKSFGIFFYK